MLAGIAKVFKDNEERISEFGHEAAKVIAEEGRAAGVEISGGTQIRARFVTSSINAKQPHTKIVICDKEKP